MKSIFARVAIGDQYAEMDIQIEDDEFAKLGEGELEGFILFHALDSGALEMSYDVRGAVSEITYSERLH